MSKHALAIEILARHANGAQATLDAVKSEMDLRQSRMNYDTAMGKDEDPDQRAAYDKAAADLTPVREKVDSLAGSIDALIRDRNESE